MSRWNGGAFSLGLLTIALVGFAPGQTERSESRWLNDYVEAGKTAGRSGQPMFVVFR